MADIYQPAEEKYQVTRQLLQVLKKHKCPFAIGTKSDLVIRDIDIIAEAAKKTWVCTSISITTLDETLAKKLDPNAPSPKRRLAALKRLADAGVMTGIWMTPVIPCITDSYQNMEAVIEAAVANGAKFVLGGGLDMRDPSRVRRFMVENYPEVVPKFDRLFHWTDKPHTHYPDEAYLYDLTKKFIVICQKAGVESFSPHLYNRRQAWLFYVRNFGQFKGTPLFELTQIINYLTPPKEMFQRLNITAGRNSVCKGFLKTMRYLPH
jgi:DNA repair photolyase